MKKLYFLFFFFLLCLSSASYFSELLKNFFHGAVYPFLIISNSSCNLISPFFQKKMADEDAQEKIKLIEQELQLAKEKIIDLKSKLSFFEKTAELFEFKTSFHLQSAQLCRIILLSMPPQRPHYIFVNRGAKHGIEKDMIAVSGFQIIGRVSEVYRWYSKVMLISDPQAIIAAKTGEREEEGMCVGDGVGGMIFKSKKSTCSVQEDELIFSSGVGLVFPEGFCIGSVKKCTKEECYLLCQVLPEKQIASLTHCLLLRQEDVPFF